MNIWQIDCLFQHHTLPNNSNGFFSHNCLRKNDSSFMFDKVLNTQLTLIKLLNQISCQCFVALVAERKYSLKSPEAVRKVSYIRTHCLVECTDARVEQ